MPHRSDTGCGEASLDNNMKSDDDGGPTTSGSEPGRITMWAVAGLGMLLIASTVWSVHRSRASQREKAEMQRLLPHPRDDAYVSSNSCQSCHPGEYASWHKTFHRTMTQPAHPGIVAGAFDGSTVVSDGLEYRVYRKGDEFWAEMPDPEEMMYVVQGGKPTPLEKIPRVHRRVVMCTGSHHYQTYWVTGDPKYGNLLQTLPLIYLIKDKRWIPREAAFMKDPHDAKRMITQWNNHCINCHSTGGNPGLITKTKEGSFATEVGELGISCEACHGPAEEHIRANRNPLRRYALHRNSTKTDSTIVNPANLDHRRSSQVCGQCHGVYIRTDPHGMKYATEGIQYQPGDDIDEVRYYIAYPREGSPKRVWEEYEKNPDFYRQRWWEDGTILAGGREYSALSASACYTRGKISCLTCHSMHDSDPVDQLKPVGASNASCTECHSEPRFTARLQEHTHHEPTSSGSSCMNCHMPHTTYALFSAIRTHQIESPKIDSSAKYGVPNACNLCHLDKTLAWTQDHMHERYGTAKVALTQEQQEISAALLWMLKGHAAQRVITAWHAGWEPAHEASGDDWLAPFQARLLQDPYGVVRYVAHEQLKKLPGFAGFQYDFLGDEAALEASVRQAIQIWKMTGRSQAARGGNEILIGADGQLNEAAVQTLLRQRDNRTVEIRE
ncbi:MAG: ammonia-forming cytochrome c nitrite reductase subunit c552 [Planctomycetes bacterium]|nr:ammonia-forming cytochrome c nitrite reductase subunit c552 [Planctomycetota bacterium]